MLNKSLVKYYISLVAGMLLLAQATIVNGQVQLQSIQFAGCHSSSNVFEVKPIYKQVWVNDSILQIETVASANCIGVNNPRVKTHGPLLWLEFDEFKIDTGISPFTHKRGELKVADCNCIYRITWVIKGVKKEVDYIVVLNRQISSDYNKELLDKLLSKYEIYNKVTYFFLRNAIDKNGWMQGIQIFEDETTRSYKVFHDGVEETVLHPNYP